MKLVKTDYDGHFNYQGKEIYYRMQDEIRSSISRNREMITRFINFFNEQGVSIGSRACYDTADEMMTITPEKALDWYKEMLPND